MHLYAKYASKYEDSINRVNNLLNYNKSNNVKYAAPFQLFLCRHPNHSILHEEPLHRKGHLRL